TGATAARSRSANPRRSREEVEQQRVDLARAFQVDPVAAVGEHVHAGEAGQPVGLVVDRVAEPQSRAVALAGDEDRGLRGRVERGEVLPVAGEVAVAVERAGEAVSLEGR